MAANFNVDLLYALYSKDVEKADNQNGLIKQADFDESVFTVSGDTVTVTESDGDVFTYNIADITGTGAGGSTTATTDSTAVADTTAAAAATTAATTSTSATSSTTRSVEVIEAELNEVKTEIATKKAKIAENEAKISELQEQVDAIYGDIEKTVAEYIDKAEDIAEELKAKVKEITEREIEKYKNGEYESPEELHKAIESGVEGILSSSALAALMTELKDVLESKKAEAEPLITEMNTLNAENATLNSELSCLEQRETDLAQELCDAKCKPKEEPKKCEPQGFSVKDDNGMTYQYDFFVDRDNNGDLTDASEFLGAERYAAGGQEGAWSEMTDLDTDGDGFVTAEEMDAGNVKVVMTSVDADGNKTQKAVSATEAFGENSDFKVNTTQNAEKSTDDVPMNFNDEKYANSGNELLGNFNVTFDGKEYVGYQTADSYEYLDDNYTFTSGQAENKTKDILNAGLLFNTDSFKYDIDKIVDALNTATKEDLIEYAEEICAQNDIYFGESEQKEPVEGDEEPIDKEPVEDEEDPIYVSETEAEIIEELLEDEEIAA